MEKLESCPFCGGVTEIMIKCGNISVPFVVMCRKCCYETPMRYKTREDAIREWNIRARRMTNGNNKSRCTEKIIVSTAYGVMLSPQKGDDFGLNDCSNCGFGARTHEMYPGSCPNYHKGENVHCTNWEK